MITIVTNEEKRMEQIEAGVNLVIQKCKSEADCGKRYAYVILPRNIQREVRDILEKTTNIYVTINYGATPSRKCVEYIDENNVEVKFTWCN